MPADFDRCVAEGGKVRTIDVPGQPDYYRHVCIDRNGDWHAGEKKKRKHPKEGT